MVEYEPLYSLRQQKVLVVLPLATGPLSIVGSLLVVYIILNDYRNKLRRVYHRLLLGLSLTDIVCTGGLVALSGWAVPKGTPGAWGAKGTVLSCEVAAFFLQLTACLSLYTAFLSFYYLLIIRFRKNERFIARRVEPFLHGFALLFPVTTGIAAWAKGYFNPLDEIVGWCWMSALPDNCVWYEEVPCVRGEDYGPFSRGIGAVAIGGSWALVVVDMVWIIVTVRATESRSARRYSSRTGMRRTKETAVQALLYIGAFSVTYIATLILQVSQKEETADNRTFHFVAAAACKALMPMQGFWNALIYVRPRYKKLLAENRAMGLCQLMASIVTPKNIIAQKSGRDITTTTRTSATRSPGRGEVNSQNEPDDFAPETDFEEEGGSAATETTSGGKDNAQQKLPDDSKPTETDSQHGGCP